MGSREISMGLIHANIVLKNPQRSKLAPVKTTASVDSGAVHLCIPEHIQLQLKLKSIDQKEFSLAEVSF